MRIFMLGWEFPPFIAGGLGTACYGLTRALDRLGEQVLFVLPKPAEAGEGSPVTLLSPSTLTRAQGPTVETISRLVSEPQSSVEERERFLERFEREELVRSVIETIPLGASSPYAPFQGTHTVEQVERRKRKVERLIERARAGDARAAQRLELLQTVREAAREGDLEPIGEDGSHYGSDLVGDAARYARLAVRLAQGRRFDVVHAHDWLTYPAGIAVSRLAGVPLVVHVHATEFDRSGGHVNQQVFEIERAGMHAADRVIAVSALTKSICVNRYAVPEDKIAIVYNGVDRESGQPRSGDRIASDEKIVLFLGRITLQKGPEYFIEAARRVLEKVPNVRFIVAGSGDMALRMIEMAAALGIEDHVLFTGFLRGRDVERIFRMADCYVMPSVSEPFGIAALEAISHDVPVIISKQSGVAEVLTHALKVDFWDTEEMANKIAAVLKYPPLSQTLKGHGDLELRRLTWDGAAARCVGVYADALAAQRQHAGG